MSVGTRIAQKRKELGLSQEALGERMGVSRQSIYKWESDAALPEIEKLVNLSRTFGVSVGWLLGEEDTPEKPELTPAQLAMVEEIVGRYLDARRREGTVEDGDPGEEAGGEAPEGRLVRRLRVLSAGLILLGAAATAASLFSRLDQVTNDYNRLQSSVNYISTDVGYQIRGIAGQVEEVLNRQNDLTAEQSAQITDTDYSANTVTISMRALPRTFTEGMTAEFLLSSGRESFTVPGVLGADHAFTGSVTLPLSDNIPVSVAFITGDRRETQLLNEFFSLYSESFPDIGSTPGGLWGTGNEIRPDASLRIGPEELAQIQSLRLGLFRDQTLVAWYKQLDGKPDNIHYHGAWDDVLFFRLPQAQAMEPGHIYAQALVIVDQYGRERVYPSLPVEYDAQENFASHIDDGGIYYARGTDPQGWVY